MVRSLEHVIWHLDKAALGNYFMVNPKEMHFMKKIIVIVALSLIAAKVFAQPLEPLAPMGTSKCEVIQVCDEYGNNCRWITVCR